MKNLWFLHGLPPWVQKDLRKMKLTVLFLCISVMAGFASISYAQSTKLTVVMKNAKVVSILNEIEDQSEFRFFFSNDVDVERKASIDKKDVTVFDILDELFKDTNVKYEVYERQIALIDKSDSFFNRNLVQYEQNAGQQQRTVSGTVTDQSGQPLPGVTIVVKGTTQGTVTNAAGEYSFTDISEDATLVFSFVGMKTQEVAVGSQTIINVTMEEETIGLEEVVAIGYGTQRKVNMTGAVDVITPEKLENRQSSTVSQLLQGQAPGINFDINNDGFQPGAEMIVDIRGVGSLSGGEPYVVIDGFPGDMNSVNPEDIESISVLKDAAASAIYGARAPYGVILITTKSGKKDTKFSVTYSGNVMVNTPSNLPSMVDSYTYARVMNEAGRNAGGAPFTEEEIARILLYQAGDIEGLKQYYPEDIRDKLLYYETVPDYAGTNNWENGTDAHANYDWYDDWYGHSVNQKHNLSFTGGTGNISYYLSAGYLDQEGVLNYGEDTFDRINVLAKINTAITDWWDFRYEPRLIRTKRIRPTNQNRNYTIVFHQIGRTYPTQPKYDGWGHYETQSKIPWTEYGGTEDTYTTTQWHTFATEIRPVKGWQINADFAYNSRSQFMSVKDLTVYEYLLDETIQPTTNTVPSSISNRHRDEYYWTSNVYSSYKLNFEEGHNFEFLGGVQFEAENYTYLNATKTNLMQQDIPSLQTASGEPTVYENLAHMATQGVFGRMNYNYKDKYLLETNARYDGSSRFKEGRRWGFFPSLSLGWNIHREPFWDTLSDFINTFKVRGSWGSLGNQNITPYQDINLMPLSTNPVDWIYGYGSSRPIGYTGTPSLVSPDLTWETATTTNIGANVYFLENKLQLDFDWFERITTDMIGPVGARPGIMGTTVPQSNNATLQTRGFELSVGWKDNLANGLNYYVKANLYDNTSIVKEYYNPTNILSSWYEGREVGEIWGYTASGLFQSQEEIDAYRAVVDLSEISGTWNPGDVKYDDIDGDGVINRGDYTLDNPGDYSIIGNSTPHYQYGLSAGLDYKGFDFSFLIKGVAKRNEWFSMYRQGYWGMRIVVHSLVTPEHLDYFRDQPGDKYFGLYEGEANINKDSFWPRAYLDGNENYKNREVSDRYLGDASYWRIQNIQLGYTLPQTIASRLKLQNLRVYVSAENLYTHHNFPVKGIDPVAPKGTYGAGSTYGADVITSLGITITYQ